MKRSHDEMNSGHNHQHQRDNQPPAVVIVTHPAPQTHGHGNQHPFFKQVHPTHRLPPIPQNGNQDKNTQSGPK